MAFAEATAAVMKPRMRGVLHQYASVAVLSAGIILIVEARTRSATFASSVYVAACTFQFFISALYHTGHWPPHMHKLLRRMDHSAIYALIAATYTPLVLVPLRGTEIAGRLLIRVWLAAAAGIGKTLWFPNAPKQLSAVIYVLMGWQVLPYVPVMLEEVGLPIVLLVAAGGVTYTLGAAVYAAGWPNPVPHVFGFHEIFHALVILASVLHFTAVYITVTKLAPEGAVISAL